MLGHQLVKSLGISYDVYATYRRPEGEYDSILANHSSNSHFNLDVRSFSAVEKIIRDIRPDVVINSIGIVKQRDDASDSVLSIEVNSLFPHQLSSLAKQIQARLVTISTDCVFSGATGMYRESDTPDAADIYGRSKLLGEVYDEHALTLRTSIIGLETSRNAGLVEWFLAQNGSIRGYRNAIFSGLTTVELARVIDHCIGEHPECSGLYHVSSQPISKFDLLCGLREKLGLSIEIVADEDFSTNKSLDSSRFRMACNYDPPSWDVMLDELASQITERKR